MQSATTYLQQSGKLISIIILKTIFNYVTISTKIQKDVFMYKI